MFFDGCGNRTTLNGVPQTFDNMNQLSRVVGVTEFDPKGNLWKYGGWTYTYDAQNRLTQASNATTTALFYYDAKNRQIARSIGGLFTFSVWDDWELIEEYAAGNIISAKYLQGAHGPVKSLLNNIYFYQDALGSTSHITDSTGHLAEYYKYDLYGKPTYWDPSGNQISGSNPAYNVRDLFAGERYIPEIGLYDDRNRFMSPELGRFLQPDPIGFKGDASNLYRYCGNDWANRTDSTGLGMDSTGPGPANPLMTATRMWFIQKRLAQLEALKHAMEWPGHGAIAIGTINDQIGRLTKVNDFHLWTFRKPIIYTSDPILMKQTDGTYKAQGDQAKTSPDLTPASAERDARTGRIQLSQGILLQPWLPKGASKELYNEEMQRSAALEASARSGPLREMANQVERMPFHSTQEAENAANRWMQRAFRQEVDRLIGVFDRPITGTPQY